MHTQIFYTQQEYNEATFVNTARLLYESSYEIVSGGNIADSIQVALYLLLDEARNRKYTKQTTNALAFYYHTLLEENNQTLEHI